MNSSEKSSSIKNPLVMVGVFASISELAMSVVLTQLPSNLQEKFLWFVMGFPSVLICIFFFILYKRPAVFFSPSDYSRQELYVSSIGATSQVPELTIKMRQLEETVVALQAFIGSSKEIENGATDLSKALKSIDFNFRLEANPFFAHMKNELKIEPELIMDIVKSETDLTQVAAKIAKISEKKADRFRILVTSFPDAASDFLQLKELVTKGEE